MQNIGIEQRALTTPGITREIHDGFLSSPKPFQDLLVTAVGAPEAVSAKRYVVYKRKKDNIEIIKPSEHGLGIVFVPDKRARYKSPDCKDQETDYARWIVEA